MPKAKTQALRMTYSFACMFVMLFCSLIYAQPVDPDLLAASPQEAGVTFSLDTQSLLTHEEIFPTEVAGPVWRATANASYGKMLVQIPLLLEPGEKPVEISKSYLKIAKGKFVCYRMDDYGETENLIQRARADNREFAAGAKRYAKKAPDLSVTPPVMTKSFILLPDGKVQFKTGLVSRSCEVIPYTDGDSLYKLKLDIKMYQALRPGSTGSSVRPTRSTRPTRSSREDDLGGGATVRPTRSTRTARSTDNSREARLAKAAASRALRKENKAYQELGKKARALTKELEIDKPARIWIVFEVDSDVEELRISGSKPLPWTLEMETFKELRAISSQLAVAEEGFDGVERLAPPHSEIIFKLAEILAQNHPYNLQLAALTINLTHMSQFSQLGDGQFFLLKALLESDDSMARRFVMADLRQTFPPTRATLELAKLMVIQTVGNLGEKTAALAQMLKGINGDPTQAASSAETLNTMLASEGGPAPGTLLKSMFDASRENEDVLNVFVQSTRFQSLPEARLNEALVYVVENAGAEPLAVGWLNEHFLGSANIEVLKKTLTVIADADTGARDLGPMFNWAVDKLFGKPSQQQGQKLRKARMRQPIPILTPFDGIFRALQHGNKEIRELAWRSLPRFVFPVLDEDVEPLPKDSDRYQILLNTALDMLTTPAGVVAFFERQPNKQRVAECMVQLVLRGSSHVQLVGVRAIIGSESPLGEVMLELSPGERQGLAMLVYEMGAKIIPPPMVVNVLRRREVNNPVARWFGDEVAKGEIPSASEWVDQFEGEAHLLDLVASNDQSLAQGAAAVMVTAVGGSDRDAMRFRETVRTLGDQTAQSVADSWMQIKLELFSAQLKRYEGHYNLVLLVAESDNFGGELDVPMREIPVGVVQLRINTSDKTASLSNEKLEVAIGSEYHTIEIGKPAELKSFPNEELQNIPLEEVTDPVLVRLLQDGTWKGTFNLPDGIVAQLQMIPLKTGTISRA
ncbi:MAG: hypothetical protein JKX85_14525 [Phycisphaeraceae bacterium]|nr:hypothetical protein [Phycisphaeraceae bacterium]